VRVAEDVTSNVNSAMEPALCGIPCGNISFDETITVENHHYNN
jgi:hypothetical protein